MHTEKPGLSTLFVKSGVQNRWELQSKTCASFFLTDAQMSTVLEHPSLRQDLLDRFLAFPLSFLLLFPEA